MQSKRETKISEQQGSELQSQVVAERTINVLSDKNQKELLEKSDSWGRATAWRTPQAEYSSCSTDDLLSTHIGFFEFKSFYPCSFSDTGRVPQRNIFYVHKCSAEKRGEGEEREKRGERDWSHVELRKAKLWEIFSAWHSSFLALSHASPFTPSHLSLQQYLLYHRTAQLNHSFLWSLRISYQTQSPLLRKHWHMWNLQNLSCLWWLMLHWKPHSYTVTTF